jgi:superkiller protein 3
MVVNLILLFGLALCSPPLRDCTPSKAQDWLPEYVERGKEEKRQQNENIKRAQQVTIINPNSGEAFFILGEAYRINGGANAEAAAEAYKRAISLKPNYSEAYKGLAWAYGALKQSQKRTEALEQAIELNPNDAEAFCKLGDAYNEFDIGRQVPPLPSDEELKSAVEAHRKKAESAVEAYKQAIAIKPGYAEAYSGLGSAYLILQRKSDAIEAYTQAIEYDSHNPLMRIGLGYAYLHFRDSEAALEQHKAAMQLIENVKEPDARSAYEMGARMLLDRIKERIKEKKQR